MVRHFNLSPWCSTTNDQGRSDYPRVNNAAIQGHYTAILEKRLSLNIALFKSQSERYYSKHQTERELQGLLIQYKTPANTRSYHIIRRRNFLRVRVQVIFIQQEFKFRLPRDKEKCPVLPLWISWMRDVRNVGAYCDRQQNLNRLILANISFWNMRASDLWGVGTETMF